MCLECKEGPLVGGLLCCVWYFFIEWGLAHAVCGWRLQMWRGWGWVGVTWWGGGCRGGGGLKWYRVAVGSGWWVGPW